MRRARLGIVLLPLLTACGTSALEGEPAPGSGSGRPYEEGRSVRARAAMTAVHFPFDVQVSPVSGSAGWDSERLWSEHIDWEPVVAADPSSERVYQAVTRYGVPACEGCADPAVVVRRSDDGGATWGPDVYVDLSSGTQGDAQVRVAENGAVFVAYLHDWRPGVAVVRSTDGGRTWSSPAYPAFDLDWSDRPILFVSPDGRDVYVAFNARRSLIAASHDGGVTFLPPVRTDHGQRYWFHSAAAVAPDGTLYVGATDFRSDYSGASHISVLRSRDRGASWRATRVDTSAEAPGCEWAKGCYFGYLGPSVALAVDAAGTVMVVYHASETAGAAQQLWFRTSTNGRKWSRAQRLSVAASGVNNAFPALAAGQESGDFRVVWVDDRKAPTEAWNAWYRETSDAGKHWSRAVRLSDQGSGAPYKRARGFLFPYGDYLGLEVGSDGRNHIVWGAGESFAGQGGAWFTRSAASR